MPTYRVQIKGIVQGVGFRPYVYRKAIAENIKGWIQNGSDGVVIQFNHENEQAAKTWLNQLLHDVPSVAHISSVHMEETDNVIYQGFSIQESTATGSVDTPITPDFAVCSNCIQELEDSKDRRFQYAFITCTDCGPRYSITKKIPYDRAHTTMDAFEMCPTCAEEYDSPETRRYYSQTNSCDTCGIKMQVFDSACNNVIDLEDEATKIDFAVNQLLNGKIVAVKGIGGYLLMCDATSDEAVSRLRKLKQRPHKPFAIMHTSIESVREAYQVSAVEEEALTSLQAPIVLIQPKENPPLSDEVAPYLTQIGVMLPSAPLLYLISKKSKVPLVATSANISGSPIIFDDEEAVTHLKGIADYILMHNREILIPQDDSVVKFTPKYQQRIVLRRSRGFAPNFLENNISTEPIGGTLAVGAEMKGTFALTHKQRIYISQFLGNLGSYDSQESFKKVYEHLQSLLGFVPKKIIADKHPSYFGHQWGREEAEKASIEWEAYQHHEAHFAAVLGENELLDEEVLGFIWDGTGLSSDGKIWGSETFLWKDGETKHVGNIGYVPNISGDQMALQPRISALAFTEDERYLEKYVASYFSPSEWQVFKQVKQRANLETSSMGRLFDAVSCLLTGTKRNTFEGQASLYLETLAQSFEDSDGLRFWEFEKDTPLYAQCLQNVYQSLEKGWSTAEIAFQFHHFLVHWIKEQAKELKTKKLAFSGGVFQNGLLVDLIIEHLSNDFEVFFHQELSPNDENIAYGQLILEKINTSISFN